ncbi:unnamed protein product [Euphydryas editha]|uniref:Uncharacterized protein n=1 Tax=Euphydryas editha TaxID=104508 RepID=A0AAU9TJQ4_EUPED|nr:unnamed protein product [Euphydryas editha]
MIQLKERKEMDEAFKKAQKPWAKLLQKVERTRLEYHTACKQERTAQNQERNASGDSSLSPDQIDKNRHSNEMVMLSWRARRPGIPGAPGSSPGNPSPPPALMTCMKIKE